MAIEELGRLSMKLRSLAERKVEIVPFDLIVEWPDDRLATEWRAARDPTPIYDLGMFCVPMTVLVDIVLPTIPTRGPFPQVIDEIRIALTGPARDPQLALHEADRLWRLTRERPEDRDGAQWIAMAFEGLAKRLLGEHSSIVPPVLAIRAVHDPDESDRRDRAMRLASARYLRERLPVPTWGLIVARWKP